MRRVLPALISSLLTAGLLLAGPPAGAQVPADPVPSTYTSMSPMRVLDTRNGTGTGTTNPVGPGGVVTIDLSSRVPATANGYAAKSDGTAWAWGIGFTGELGDGVDCPPASGCHSNVPVRVANLSDVTQVGSFGYGGYALRADGTVWSWGRNEWGSLGNDSVADHSIVPVRVDGLSGASAVNGVSGSGYALVP